MPRRVSVAGNTVIGTTSAQLVPANPKRICLTLFAANGARYTFGFNTVSAIDVGPTLTTNTNPMVLDWERYGDTVQQAVYAFASVAGTNVGWIDTSLVD